MKSLIEDIKNKQYKKVYLLYGPEDYLKRKYKLKLLEALITKNDIMNFIRFEGNDQNEEEIIDLGETMPFFSNRRVILLDHTGCLKGKSDLIVNYMTSLPDYLVIIFVEEEVDKRSRMFKVIQKHGRTVEFPVQNEETLIRWVLGILKKEGKKITRRDMELFLEQTGTDMELIDRELEKLLAYTMGRDVISVTDIKEVCKAQITNQIFDMVRAVSEKQREKALNLYYDLLALKEPPMRIFYLLARQFNLCFQIKKLQESGCDQRSMASRTGLAPFVVKKYISIVWKYSTEELYNAVEDFAQTEADIKTGRLNDMLSVELMIFKYSSQENSRMKC
ncbi:MAG: DNA polymerase III subunit delta [Lachnospiraceae bacterium]|nr:DNA polymerase III subunit delta [Lachnospiraceae bacterium]